MSGQQVYIYQQRNLLPHATVDCLTSASTKPPLVYPVRKSGNGNLRAFGQYSGDEDAAYALKIIDTALTAPFVSVPTFAGAGSGTISDIVARGLSAQTIRVVCLSTGVSTASAEVEIEGVRFRAKASGSQGNLISLKIDDSMLSFTPTNYSMVKELRENDTALQGAEWDFDTKPIAGTVLPSDVRRISFGEDRLHIYRQYKSFTEGVWKYHFIPPIRSAVPSGTRVNFVTGGRTVTVTNGATTEVYQNVVTIADLWSQVKDSSSLIEPVSKALELDPAPTSPAVREFAQKTSAYALPSYKGGGSSEYVGALENVSVSNRHTKTELIEVRCTDNTYAGAEIWSVKGSSSGVMGQARTGLLNTFGNVNFEIPRRLREDCGSCARENWSSKISYAGRPDGVTPPVICFNMRLGVNAAEQTLTLEYKRKPAECDCPPVMFSERCLGYEKTEGGEIRMALTVPDLVFWTEVVRERMKEKFWEFSNYTLSAEAFEGRPGWDVSSIHTFEGATAVYFTAFRFLAQRIMALPEEDDSATLQLFVDQYKQLVQSLHTVYAYKGVRSTLTWDGAKWTPNGVGYYDANLVDWRYDTDLYQSIVDGILNYERASGVKKNSPVAAAGCYTRQESEYYWEVRGSKQYAAAFTDLPYYSAVELPNGGYEGTKEFAFLISTPCGGALMAGDNITVTIQGTSIGSTYREGDIYYLPTIAAHDLCLRAGVDGDDTYVFSVTGDSRFPNYSLNRLDPRRYDSPNLKFQITHGVVPFRVGDMFTVAIEGGQFAWRKGSGAWSSPLVISPELQPLDKGLSILFDFGVSPSFVQGDEWEILALQENRAANLLTPWETWNKAAGARTFAFSAPVAVDTLLIAMHTISGSVRVQAAADEDFEELVHDELYANSPVICKLWPETITAQYFRVVTTGENSIGYAFLGRRMMLSLDADSCEPTMKYSLSRHDGREPFSLFSHKYQGYMVRYSSFIWHSDWQQLGEMIDYLKQNGDMPLYFIPNINYPELCARMRVNTDAFDIECPIDLNAAEDRRLYTITLPLEGAV